MENIVGKEEIAQKPSVYEYLWRRGFTCCSLSLDPFPDDKNLTSSKLKAFADDTINVTHMIISVFDGVENIVGKGENAGYHNVLKRLLSQTRQKLSLCAQVPEMLCVIHPLYIDIHVYNKVFIILI